LLASRASANIAGRDYVTTEEVKAVAQPVVAHRFTVKPQMWLSEIIVMTLVVAVLEAVQAPAPLEVSPDAS
ncbi:MAG TPA: ATPase, partial [Ilumatobacteraceae bacterium]|nr:ATPase [Ilumatobacteraceae bacterium]